LAGLSWWKTDVSTVKLGIQKAAMTEVTIIGKGEYGMGY